MTQTPVSTPSFSDIVDKPVPSLITTDGTTGTADNLSTTERPVSLNKEPMTDLNAEKPASLTNITEEPPVLTAVEPADSNDTSSTAEVQEPVTDTTSAVESATDFNVMAPATNSSQLEQGAKLPIDVPHTNILEISAENSSTQTNPPTDTTPIRTSETFPEIPAPPTNSMKTELDTADSVVNNAEFSTTTSDPLMATNQIPVSATDNANLDSTDTTTTSNTVEDTPAAESQRSATVGTIPSLSTVPSSTVPQTLDWETSSITTDAATFVTADAGTLSSTDHLSSSVITAVAAEEPLATESTQTSSIAADAVPTAVNTIEEETPTITEIPVDTVSTATSPPTTDTPAEMISVETQQISPNSDISDVESRIQTVTDSDTLVTKPSLEPTSAFEVEGSSMPDSAATLGDKNDDNLLPQDTVEKVATPEPVQEMNGASAISNLIESAFSSEAVTLTSSEGPETAATDNQPEVAADDAAAPNTTVADTEVSEIDPDVIAPTSIAGEGEVEVADIDAAAVARNANDGALGEEVAAEIEAPVTTAAGGDPEEADGASEEPPEKEAAPLVSASDRGLEETAAPVSDAADESKEGVFVNQETIVKDSSGIEQGEDVVNTEVLASMETDGEAEEASTNLPAPANVEADDGLEETSADVASPTDEATAGELKETSPDVVAPTITTVNDQLEESAADGEASTNVVPDDGLEETTASVNDPSSTAPDDEIQEEATDIEAPTTIETDVEPKEFATDSNSPANIETDTNVKETTEDIGASVDEQADIEVEDATVDADVPAENTDDGVELDDNTTPDPETPVDAADDGELGESTAGGENRDEVPADDVADVGALEEATVDVEVGEGNVADVKTITEVPADADADVTAIEGTTAEVKVLDEVSADTVDDSNMKETTADVEALDEVVTDTVAVVTELEGNTADVEVSEKTVADVEAVGEASANASADVPATEGSTTDFKAPMETAVNTGDPSAVAVSNQPKIVTGTDSTSNEADPDLGKTEDEKHIVSGQLDDKLPPSREREELDEKPRSVPATLTKPQTLVKRNTNISDALSRGLTKFFVMQPAESSRDAVIELVVAQCTSVSRVTGWIVDNVSVLAGPKRPLGPSAKGSRGAQEENVRYQVTLSVFCKSNEDCDRAIIVSENYIRNGDMTRDLKSHDVNAVVKMDKTDLVHVVEGVKKENVLKVGTLTGIILGGLGVVALLAFGVMFGAQSTRRRQGSFNEDSGKYI